MRKRWAGVLPLVMVAGSLVAVPQVASPAQAAPAPATTLQPSSPITMERFNYWSGVSTQFVRPVVLQKKVGSSWGTIFSGKTGANGKFWFAAHTGSTDILRSCAALVPLLCRSGEAQGPDLSGVGDGADHGAAGEQEHRADDDLALGGTVTTSPARNGRLVTAQRRNGKQRAHASHGRTNATGKYPSTSAAKPGDYYILTVRPDGNALTTLYSSGGQKKLEGKHNGLGTP